MKTYDEGHPGTLYHSHQKQHSTQYPPATFHFLLTTRNDHNVGYQRHSLSNHREGHQKADGAPHGAKIAVIVAVFRLWEVLARVREGRTAFVEAVGIVDVFAAGLFVERASAKV